MGNAVRKESSKFARDVCMRAKGVHALNSQDLPLVLALARTRTLARAAERLDVDASTIFRRLNDLERRLRVRLFDRSTHGYALTAAGQRAAATAERIETELHALDREIAGREQQLMGSVRITASETLSYAVLPPLLAKFHAVHPCIQLTLAIDNRVLDLTRREADVALRTRRPSEGSLFGRRLARIAWAFYGAKGSRLLQRNEGAPLELTRQAVIGWARGAHRRERLDRGARSGDADRLSKQQPHQSSDGCTRGSRYRTPAMLSGGPGCGGTAPGTAAAGARGRALDRHSQGSEGDSENPHLSERGGRRDCSPTGALRRRPTYRAPLSP